MIEVLADQRWRPADGTPARIPETDSIHLRGLPPGMPIRIGPIEIEASADGAANLRMADWEELNCHVGLLTIEAHPWRGEVEVVPTKISVAALRTLQSDLESTWAGLLMDQSGPTSERATGPDARRLWRRLGPAVEAIRRTPLARLCEAVGTRRQDRVRRVGELTPAVLMAGLRGAAARTRVLELAPAVAEHRFVGDTLRHLARYSRHQVGTADVAQEIENWLRVEPFNSPPSPTRSSPSHALRHDRRFRQVLAVRRALEHPLAIITDGPGDLRVSVQALDRLYEYWVFLQVLRQATRELGPPEPFIEQLTRRLPGGRRRLEFPPGATVRFPDGWLVAFEPTISTNPRQSWQELEYVPHPDPAQAQRFITPDICVLKESDEPKLWIIDAKYQGRHRIDQALAETHSKYSRIHAGRFGVVEEVIVAHPHPALTRRWAGHSALPFVPNVPAPRLDWLAATLEIHAAPPLAVGANPPTIEVRIILDQTWLRSHIGDERVDLRKVAERLAAGRQHEAILIAPDLPALFGFFAAVAQSGWRLERTRLERADQLVRVAELCRLPAGEVMVVSGLIDFHNAAREVRNVAIVDTIS